MKEFYFKKGDVVIRIKATTLADATKQLMGIVNKPKSFFCVPAKSLKLYAILNP